jgi:hypothetical protein
MTGIFVIALGKELIGHPVLRSARSALSEVLKLSEDAVVPI